MSERIIHCVKLEQDLPGLDKAPYPTALGERIFNEISKDAWQGWLGHQTMLINENRLNLMEPTARKFLMSEMEKYLFGAGSDLPAGYTQS